MHSSKKNKLFPIFEKRYLDIKINLVYYKLYSQLECMLTFDLPTRGIYWIQGNSVPNLLSAHPTTKWGCWAQE